MRPEFVASAPSPNSDTIKAGIGGQTKLVLVATGTAQPSQQSLIRLLIPPAGCSGSLAGNPAAFFGPGDVPIAHTDITAWGHLWRQGRAWFPEHY